MTPDQELCLQYARELKDEMSAAILAISGNSLDAFEESLWKQQVLCVSLRRALESLQEGNLAPSEQLEVQSAVDSLRGLNRTYNALIQQSRSSCDLLSKLCLGYAETWRDASCAHSESPVPRGLTCTV